jgi:hypothetical protein
MKVRTLIIAMTGCMASAASLASTCPPVYTTDSPIRCDLYRGQEVTLTAGESTSQRILVPLNTTIVDGELPLYAVDFHTRLGGGFDAARVRVTLWMSDDTGGHRLELGATESTVYPGDGKVSLAVSGQRFAQPAHLNVEVRRVDDEAPALILEGIRVIQSFNPDVEGVMR